MQSIAWLTKRTRANHARGKGHLDRRGEHATETKQRAVKNRYCIAERRNPHHMQGTHTTTWRTCRPGKKCVRKNHRHISLSPNDAVRGTCETHTTMRPSCRPGKNVKEKNRRDISQQRRHCIMQTREKTRRKKSSGKNCRDIAQQRRYSHVGTETHRGLRIHAE
jgi:hypothetical protein